MTIPDIKQRLTIAEVLQHYGLKTDRSYRMCCPFHEDKTPSMQLYFKTNTAYCFSGNCKTHGRSLDVIDFVMYKENSSKQEALEKCKNLIGVYPLEEPVQEPTLQAAKNYNRTTFLTEMFKTFSTGFTMCKPAQEYAKKRGLDATKLKLAYNSGHFHYHTKDSNLIPNALYSGLLFPSKNKSRTGERTYTVFGKNSLAFALRNKNNEVVGLYFRSIANEATAKHYYLKDRAGLYPSYPDPQTKKLLLTESIIDAATLLQIESINKDYSILAVYGTNGLNEEIKSAITELKELEEIIFAFDSDEAGNQSVMKYSRELQTLKPNITCYRLKLPNKDVNETYIAHDESIFIHLLQEKTALHTSEKTSNTPPTEELFSFSNEIKNKENEEATQTPTQAETASSKLNKKELNTDNPNKIFYKSDIATYMILGGFPKQLDMLKVMLLVENEVGYKSRNKVDLYEDKQVEKLCKEVAEKLQLRSDLVEQDIYKLTELLEKHREESQGETKALQSETEVPKHIFTPKERAMVMDFLTQKNVIQNLNELLGKTGIVGEERNRIFLLLIAMSYKMKDPLHSLIQGSSGSGKTKIVRQIGDCIPQEHLTRFTRISDKALYNYPEHYFTNRLLIIEDVDGLSEEAEMAFRELQSSGQLISSITIKMENGNLTGGQKNVNGPIASMSCTTHGEIYEDNMSRVFLIAVDESREQTKRIIHYQNQKAAGKINSKEEEASKELLQNIIRMIEAREVVNPYAERVELPEEAHKIRRLNDLFQNFIKMIVLMNQFQRKKNTEGKLIAEIEDVETAIDIMFESIVLKVDELDGSLRQFYEKLKYFLQKQFKENYLKAEFSQREVRQALHVSKAQVNRYLQNLVELEYIEQRGFANRGFRYKVSYWDQYESMRKRIAEHLKNQIEAIRHEPPVSH